jgi:hypothetical protein
MTDHALVIQNDGDVEVRDFELRLLLEEGQRSPIWDSSRQPTDRVTVPVIHAGQKFEWLAVIYFRAPTEFDVIWSWSAGRRQREERRGRLKLETLAV